MAQYYVGLSHPTQKPDEQPKYIAFVGAFDRKPQALAAIREAKDRVEYELVTDPHRAKSDQAIVASILTSTIAKRSGISEQKTIGEEIPVKIEEIIQREIDTVKTRDAAATKNGKKHAISAKTAQEIRDTGKDAPKGTPQGEEVPDWIFSTENRIHPDELGRNELIIVARRASNLDWYQRHNIPIDQILGWAKPNQIEGKTVVGTIPYYLGSIAKRVSVMDIPNIRVNQVGETLNADELDDAGAHLRFFRVSEEVGFMKFLFEFIDKHPEAEKVLAQFIWEYEKEHPSD